MGAGERRSPIFSVWLKAFPHLRLLQCYENAYDHERGAQTWMYRSTPLILHFNHWVFETTEVANCPFTTLRRSNFLNFVDEKQSSKN